MGSNRTPSSARRPFTALLNSLLFKLEFALGASVKSKRLTFAVYLALGDLPSAQFQAVGQSAFCSEVSLSRIVQPRYSRHGCNRCGSLQEFKWTFAQVHAFLEKQKRPLYYALMLTMVFTIVQIISARVADSISLLADALHHLVDVAMIVGALIATELAQQGGASFRRYIDEHGKSQSTPELVAAIVNSIILLGLSAAIVAEGIERISGEEGHHTNGVLVAVLAAVSLVVNIIKVYLMHSMMGDSLNIRAIYIHGLADCAGALGLLLAGLLVMATGKDYWDGIFAIIISVIVIINTAWVIVPASRLLIRGSDSQVPEESFLNKETE